MKRNSDIEEIAKFDQHANAWWSKEGPLRTLHDINPTRLDYIETFVRLKNQRVLDVGCGGGILSEGMAKRGANVTGIDLASETIAIAQEHARLSSLNIHYLCQPIETFTTDPFPIITCLEMLEHVPEPQLILQEVARLLAPGGYLFLSTINRSISAYAKVIVAAEYILGLLPRQTHDYRRFIKPSELAAMVRAVGLEVVGLTGLTYHPFTFQASLGASVAENYLLVAFSSP